MTDNEIHVDTSAGTITVPHLGLTLRSIFGAATLAAHGFPALRGRRPRFRIIYSDVVIGEIRLKSIPLEVT